MQLPHSSGLGSPETFGSLWACATDATHGRAGWSGLMVSTENE